MIRGTFANIRLRNLLVERAGGFTRHFPDGEETTIYEAAMAYAEEGVPLVVLAGKEYGSGSSRDWAAKGTKLLGVRAVIAESFERIHRSNLIGMGVLPLQFADGESAESLGLTGEETFDFGDLEDGKAKIGHRHRHQRRRRRHRVHRHRPPRHPQRGHLLPQRRHPPDRPPKPEVAVAASLDASQASVAAAPTPPARRRGAAGPREAGGSARPSLHQRVGSQGGMPTRPFPWTGLPKGTVTD